MKNELKQEKKRIFWAKNAIWQNLVAPIFWQAGHCGLSWGDYETSINQQIKTWQKAAGFGKPECGNGSSQQWQMYRVFVDLITKSLFRLPIFAAFLRNGNFSSEKEEDCNLKSLGTLISLPLHHCGKISQEKSLQDKKEPLLSSNLSRSSRQWMSHAPAHHSCHAHLEPFLTGFTLIAISTRFAHQE